MIKQIKYNFNDSADSIINWIHLVNWHEKEGWKLKSIDNNIATFVK